MRLEGWSRQQIPKSVKSVKSQAKSQVNPQKSRESQVKGPGGKVWGVGSTNLGPQNHKKPHIKLKKNPKARSNLQEMKKIEQKHAKKPSTTPKSQVKPAGNEKNRAKTC